MKNHKMTLTKLLWTLLLFASHSQSIPVPNTGSKNRKMTVESHPMLASLFNTANTVKMTELSKQVHGVRKPIQGGFVKGIHGNKGMFMHASSKQGALKDLPSHIGTVEQKKTEVFPHVPPSGVKQQPGNKVPIGELKKTPLVTPIDGIADGICSHCQQTQNIQCIKIYCSNDGTANARGIIKPPVEPSINVNAISAVKAVPQSNPNMVPNPMVIPVGSGNKVPVNVANAVNLPVQGGISPGSIPITNVVPSHNLHPGVNPANAMGNQKIIQDTSSGFSTDGINFVPISELVKPNIASVTIPPADVAPQGIPLGSMGPVVSHVNINQVRSNPVALMPVPPSNPFADVRPNSVRVNEGILQQNLPAIGTVNPPFVPSNEAGFQPESQFLPVAPAFPFPNLDVVGSDSMIPEVPANNPTGEMSRPNPAVSDMNSFQQGTPIQPGVSVPVSGNTNPFLPVVPVQPVNTAVIPDPVTNDAGTSQQGNIVPNAISFDNELILVDPPMDSNPNTRPEQTIAAPGGSFSLNNVFQATDLVPVNQVPGANNQPGVGQDTNQAPPLDFVLNEAFRPLTDGLGNTNAIDIRNQNLNDIIGDLQGSNSAAEVPPARPFDTMNPLTGHNEAVMPQPASTSDQNTNLQNSPNVAVVRVSPALDFFALKPHSRITAMQQQPQVANDQTQNQGQVQGQHAEARQQNAAAAANNFFLNDVGQPIQTFSELNQKLRNIHITEQERPTLVAQSPLSLSQIPSSAISQMIGLGGAVQTTTMAPSTVTIVTLSPQRRAELNELSKTLLTDVVP